VQTSLLLLQWFWEDDFSPFKDLLLQKSGSQLRTILKPPQPQRIFVISAETLVVLVVRRATTVMCWTETRDASYHKNIDWPPPSTKIIRVKIVSLLSIVFWSKGTQQKKKKNKSKHTDDWISSKTKFCPGG
jgi:hypothetical protein